MMIQDNIIDGCGTSGVEATNQVNCTVAVKGYSISNVKKEEIKNNAEVNFEIKLR